MKGYSGDAIYKKNNLFIKETDRNVDRLLHQAHKQEKYYSRLHNPVFKIPHVKYKFSNGFAMEYIDGKDIVEVMRESPDRMEWITDQVLFLIDWEFDHSSLRPFRVQPVIDKLSPVCPVDLKEYAVQKAKSLRWRLIPYGMNHGDFTLSNMIFKDGYIYLIDLLKTFMRTPFQDIAKLQQEADLHWSFLMSDYSQENRNVKQGYDYFSWRLTQHLQEHYACFQRFIHLFHFMCLCRLFPYSEKGSDIWNSIVFRCKEMMKDEDCY